jgi:hypothetical protein
MGPARPCASQNCLPPSLSARPALHTKRRTARAQIPTRSLHVAHMACHVLMLTNPYGTFMRASYHPRCHTATAAARAHYGALLVCAGTRATATRRSCSCCSSTIRGSFGTPTSSVASAPTSPPSAATHAGDRAHSRHGTGMAVPPCSRRLSSGAAHPILSSLSVGLTSCGAPTMCRCACSTRTDLGATCQR